MAIERAYASSWGVGEMFTSAQGNALDINTTYALDKRAGYGDILQSVVVSAGAGRIISSVQTGPNSDVTWHPNGGNTIVRVPTLTAARSYTLGHSGATGGDRMIFYVEGTGASPSGYVDVKNNQGTGLFRLGMVRTGTGMSEYAEGDHAEFAFVGSGWQLMRGAGPGLSALTFTSDGFWVCPPGVHKIILSGCGGGGAGGGGRPNSTAGNRWVAGGSGGGGAWHHTFVIDVTPGVTYRIAIGAGGAPGGAGFAGTDGEDTSFSPLPAGISSPHAVVFPGAQGGKVQATTYGISSSGHYRTHGGGPVYNMAYRGWGNFADDTVMDSVPSGIQSFGSAIAPGSGGDGNGLGQGTVGMSNPVSIGGGGYLGGTGGAKGADSGTERGGGGGGGGGAGPFGPGANGGAGGAGGGSAGSAGSDAAANTGAGGGGGGSGGTAAAGSGAGGNGGAGGSGRLTITYVR